MIVYTEVLHISSPYTTEQCIMLAKHTWRNHIKGKDEVTH